MIVAPFSPRRTVSDMVYASHRLIGGYARRRRLLHAGAVLRFCLPFTASLASPAGCLGDLFAQQNVPEWSVSLELRIGAVDGPDALDVVGAMVISPRTNNLFIADRSQRISVYSPDGDKLADFGGPGAGPGEFKNLRHLYWVDPHILAVDGAYTRRVTWFTESGDVVDSRVIAARSLPGSYRPATPVAPFGQNSLLGEVSRDVIDGRLLTGETKLVRIDEAGNPATLDVIRHPETWVRMSSGRTMLGVPMVPTSRYAVHPYGSSVAIVHQDPPTSGDEGTIRVRSVGGGGKVIFARTYQYTATPLPRRYVQEFVARRGASLRQTGTSAEEAEKALRDLVPRFEPPVTAVRVGVDGSIWLGREDAGAEDVWWWVLDSQGDLIGRSQLPAGLDIRQIDGDTVWGVARDALDVNYIVKYRVSR